MLDNRDTVQNGSEKILLVDDEVALIKMTKAKLERIGYQVRGVTDPVAALKLVQADPEAFDLVITDMVMPEMNGVQLAEAVMENKPDLPVILCTGYSTISPEEAYRIGICEYVEKPVDFKRLTASIRQAIDGK